MAVPRSEPTKHFSVTLPVRATDRLDAIAAQRGSSRAILVREAVFEWLRRHDPETDYIDVEQG